MKINTSILIGLLFIIPSLITYFLASTGAASLIAIIAGLFFVITGLFETNNFRNKDVYLAFMTVLIAILLILTYNQFSHIFQLNDLVSALCLGAISLILIWTAYKFTKEWKLFKIKTISFNNLGLAVIILLMGLIVFIQVII